jgi:hypothetical protein
MNATEIQWPEPIPANDAPSDLDEDGNADVMMFLLDEGWGYPRWYLGHYSKNGGGLPGVWFTDDLSYNKEECPLHPTHWLSLPPVPNATP